ncbi:hypothetical protein EVAR_5831_1 [Eumeta japonica]|uniref:Uncharacterized protein n=1 Tax=Eumeta variegata TaxID=151549 RepID=A0A4C1T5K8_EUMVA|nr:hypothetical protein EVAR_5831_1 [Eumeta japonica]
MAELQQRHRSGTNYSKAIMFRRSLKFMMAENELSAEKLYQTRVSNLSYDVKVEVPRHLIHFPGGGVCARAVCVAVSRLRRSVSENAERDLFHPSADASEKEEEKRPHNLHERVCVTTCVKSEVKS